MAYDLVYYIMYTSLELVNVCLLSRLLLFNGSLNIRSSITTMRIIVSVNT